jgi:hypothetical protein
MINMSKLALIGAVAAVSIASPALAQSFNPRDGTGNVMPLQYQGTDGGRTAWAMNHPSVQVAARKSAPANGSVHVAVRHYPSLQKVAGHRAARHAT